MKSSPVPHPNYEQGLRTLQLATFFVSLPFFIMGLLLPVYSLDAGASALEIGLIFSAFSIVTILIRPIVGWALDRYGRRPFFILSFLAYALSMVAFAYSGQVLGFLLARLLQGAASSFLWLTANAIIADVTHEGNRAQAFGKLAQASSRGSILGAFIAFTLYNSPRLIAAIGEENIQWLLFMLFAAFSLLAFFIALARTPETVPRVSPGDSRPIHWSRPWLLLLLVTLVTAAAWSMTSPILILFLQERLNAGVDVIAWAFLPSGLIWATLPSRLGGLSDRFGRKPLMVLALILSAATMFLLPRLTSIVGLAILWALLALSFAAGDPAEEALVAELTGGDQHGRAYGFYIMASDIGAAVGPLTGGWLYDSYNPAAPFVSTGFVLALCALVLVLFLNVPKHNQAQGSS